MSLVAAWNVKQEPPTELQAVGEVQVPLALGELKEEQDGGGSGISPPSTSAVAYCKKESDGASSSESPWADSSGDESPGRQKRMRTEVAVDVAGSGKRSVAGAGRQAANIWARRLRGSTDRSCTVRSSTAISSTVRRPPPGSAEYTVEPGCFAYAKMTGSPWWPAVVYNTPSEVPQDVKRNLLAFSTVTVNNDELLVFFLGTYNLAVVHKSMIRDVVDVDPSAMLRACKYSLQRRLFRKAIRDMEEMEAEGEDENGDAEEEQQDQQGQQDHDQQQRDVGKQVRRSSTTNTQSAMYGTQAKKTSGHTRAVKASKAGNAQGSGAGEKLDPIRFVYAKQGSDPWWPAVIYDNMSDLPEGHKAKRDADRSLEPSASECIVRFVGESCLAVIAKNSTRDVQSVDEMELLQSCRSKAERARLAHAMAVMEELITGKEGEREMESIS